MEAAIATEGLVKQFSGSTRPALDKVSIRVDTGKVFTLLGRNGAGKTTFVRICATQLDPSIGEARVLGLDVRSQAKEIRHRISIVPQEGRPLRALTPWDHVYNWLQIRGVSRAEARTRTSDILQKLELYDAKDRPAMNLSGGMKQKILVAMAMAVDADLLFLDEPTIGLDPVSRRQVWAAIMEWKKRGKTVFLTTHYMDEAEALSDYVTIIDRGRVVGGGTIADLRKVIPHNTRIDIAKDGLDERQLSQYGSVVDTGAGSLRVFTYESAARDLSVLAINRNIPFSISPITLDDVFVRLVGGNNEPAN